MATVQDWINTIIGWIKSLVNLVLILVVAFLVIDILLGPDSGLSSAITGSGIVENVSDVISAFIDQGIVGLIALLVVFGIYTRE